MGAPLVLAIALALSLALGSGNASAQRAFATAAATVLGPAEQVVEVPLAPPPGPASRVALFVSGLTGDLRIRLPAAAASGLERASARALLAALHAERKGTCIRRNGRQAIQLGQTARGLLEGNPVGCLTLDVRPPDAENLDSVNLIITYN